MNSRMHISIVLGVVFVALLISGLYLTFSQSTTTVSQQKETSSGLSLPTPVSAHGTKQVAFSAKAGDYVEFSLVPETGFPPGPISGQISVNIFSDSRNLYGTTANRFDGNVALPDTASYVFQIVNDNNYEVIFEYGGVHPSSIILNHPYLEYSQVSNASMQSLGLVLIISSIGVGIASLVTATLQPRRTQLPVQ